MKISYNWLQQYISADIQPDAAADCLTATGLEVEHLTSIGGDPKLLQQLKVGEVLAKSAHPNADRLALAKVDVGDETPLDIVCGAPNLEAGQKVVVACVGVEIPVKDGESFTIRKAKIRGEHSEGMLCSEREIGLSEDHAGIMILSDTAKVGQPLLEAIDLESDYQFDIGLTPNRSDAMSHYGVARDLVAALRAQGKSASCKPVESVALPSDLPSVGLSIEDVSACPRYSLLKITGIEVKDSPKWIQQSLKSIGLKSINNVVDATNFVLWEIGQPLHAFDANHVDQESIIVRKAKNQEKFVTLDDKPIKLENEDLVIADAKSALCLAGVYGGKSSGVTEKTTSILLESAYFDATTIRKTSVRHGLRTDAAQRYEKGADPAILQQGLERAVDILRETCPNLALEGYSSFDSGALKPAEVKLSLEYLDQLSGVSFSYATVVQILEDLDIKVLNEEGGLLTLSIPMYRSDVTRPEDVIEEILRIYGFDRVSIPDRVHSSLTFQDRFQVKPWIDRLAGLLNGFGYSEIMTNSISKSKHYKRLKEEEMARVVRLENSMTSELDIMRPNLIPEGLEVIAYNINRKADNLRFFEFGHTYSKNGEAYSQRRELAIYFSSPGSLRHWSGEVAKQDFNAFKGLVDALNKSLKLSAQSMKVWSGSFAQGQEFMMNKKVFLRLGEVLQDAKEQFGIDQPVFVALFDIDNILSIIDKEVSHMMSIPTTLNVHRDLTIHLEENMPYYQVSRTIADLNINELIHWNLVDDFRDEKKIGKNLKAWTIHFVLNFGDTTPSDATIDKIMQGIIQAFQQKLGANLGQ